MYEQIINSGISTEEKNEQIRLLREEQYTLLRPTVWDQVEYESRNGAGSVAREKDRIRILYPYTA